MTPSPDDSIARVRDRSARVGVVGLGYVGSALAERCAEVGFTTIGVDIDADRVEETRRRSAPKLAVGLDHGALAAADVVLICVPTPLQNGAPDLSYILAAADDVRPILRPGALVSLESTSYPGTTEGVFKEHLEAAGLTAGIDFWLAYSPERINPGDPEYELANIPKVVAGFTSNCTEVAAAFYREIVDQVHVAPGPREAELAKLLENTYRHVNIALVNEFAMVAHELDIDIWATIEAAATKPFGFEAFRPGVGIGGHCIAVDPLYLIWKIRQLGRPPFRLVELAHEIDEAMPRYVVARITTALSEAGTDPATASVFVLGLAYKADVGDLRGSRSIQVADLLTEHVGRVIWHDPFHETVAIGGRPSQKTDLEEGLRADLTAILTPHTVYEWPQIVEASRLTFDARGVTTSIKSPKIVRL